MRLRWTYGLASAAVFGFAVSALAFCPAHQKGGSSAEADKGTPNEEAVQHDDAHTKPSTAVTVSDEVAPAAKTGCGGAARSACGHGAGCGGKKQCSEACDGVCPEAKKTSTVSTGDSATDDKVQAVLASLPSLSYRVGSETAGCPMAAKAMAEKAGVPIQYTVGEKVFSEKSDAVVALTSILEERLTEMKTVQYSVNGKCGKCPVTAKRLAKAAHAKVAYLVAGLETFDKAKADEAAKLVQKAVADVEIGYKVGDAKFGCDKMAGAKAKEAGKSMVYVVGSNETPCETTAKMLLARTKVRVAVEAAAALLIAGSMG